MDAYERQFERAVGDAESAAELMEHPLSTKEGRDAFVNRIVTSEIETLGICFPRTADVILQEWLTARKLSVDSLRRMKAAQRHSRKHFSKLLTGHGK